ncbi:cell division topological specificity factor [Actinomyces sp. B33]|uniref:cell division topological specificity factor n=1 Tax=Actinomyces sp. B33 TaxID=2942131 RepID=UPI00234076A2|nr:cell division topological specificity factor [Actinomyces sp. B33]MDC4233505.1 cell division topological specificity factor [Actinomyces sp. B33]
MALFEFEDGRLVPAQFGYPVASGITPGLIDAVCAQVLEIVSRPLFPITWRDLSRIDDQSDAPRLTALDATGQVVSVEVVAHLDSDTLISSLSRLAQTAALSWSDLAREYPGGVDSFKTGWVHFRDSMPPAAGGGPRLVMVVGSIDPQVRPALDVLAASGVEVHEMSLRQMSNGRAFLDVQAVGPRLYGHAPQVILGNTGQLPEIAALASADAPREGGRAPSAGSPLVAGAAAPDDDPQIASAGPGAQEEPHPDHADAEPVPAERRSPAPDDAPSPSAPQDAGPEAQAAPPSADGRTAEPAPDEPSAPAEAHDRAHEEEAPTVDRSETPAETPAPRVGAESAPAPGAHGDADGPVGTSDPGPVESAEILAARAAGVPVLAADDEGLRALGQIIGADTALVGRPDLDLPVDAVLTANGTIRTGGLDYADPSACLDALGRRGLSAWDELHLDTLRGPSLAEALAEVNREIIREYSAAPARPPRGRHGA